MIRVKKFGDIPEEKLFAIRDEQEEVFSRVLKTLKLNPPANDLLINLYGDKQLLKEKTGYEGNAFAELQTGMVHFFLPPDRNSIGAHELVHLLVKDLGKPVLFYSEGLAMYFDDTWHGLGYVDAFKESFSKEFQSDLLQIINDNHFRKLPEKVVYCFAGIATKELIHQRGIDLYLSAYTLSKQENSTEKNFNVFIEIFGFSVDDFLLKLLNEQLNK